MSNKETDALFQLFKDRQIHYNNTNCKNTLLLCKDLFSPNNIVVYEKQERPDILIISDTKIYGIEHFEFDDFKRKKGSTGKATIKKFEKDFKNDFKNTNMKNGQFTKCIDLSKENLSIGYDFFVNNFLESFDEHYNKIDEYKKNISNYLKNNSLNKEIEILFLIENSSLFTPLISKENLQGCVYLPFYAEEIFDKLNHSTKLNGFIYLASFSNKENINYIYSFKDGNLSNEIIEKKFYMSLSTPYIFDTVISC